MSTFSKDPAAVLDWQFDWAANWLADGETVTTHSVTVDGATLDSSTESAGVVTVWISGGTAGTKATATCRIVTSEGRTDERTLQISVRDR